jgi:hypothetical protein
VTLYLGALYGCILRASKILSQQKLHIFVSLLPCTFTALAALSLTISRVPGVAVADCRNLSITFFGRPPVPLRQHQGLKIDHLFLKLNLGGGGPGGWLQEQRS